MAHTHNHTHEHAHNSGNNIAVAFLLNLLFTIIELVGGFLTNSVAILSDALHDFGDSVSLALAWYFDRLAKHSPNARYSYGYKRFALLGALINATVLLCGSVVIIVESVQRIVEPQPVQAQGMLWLAVLGVIINGIAVLRMRKGAGVNERVVSLHMLEDVLGWLAVLVVSVVMLFVDVPVLDPILSVGVSLFVLYNVVRNLWLTFNVMLQGVPREVDYEHIRRCLQQIDGVCDVHDLHVWSLDSEYNVSSMHIVVPDSADWNDLQRIKQAAKRLLADEHIAHTTVEFERQNEECQPCN